MKTLIENVKIISPNKILIGYGVVVEDGVIKKIEKLKDIIREDIDNIVDGGGYYLSPGLVDIHSHGNSGNDIIDGREEALDNIASFNLKNGVTSFLGTIITSSKKVTEKAILNISNYNNKKNNSNLLGIHLEGPFFSIDKKGAQPEKFIKDIDIEWMKEIISLSKDKLKVVSLAPELKNSKEIVELLVEKDIKVSLGHSNATFQETKNIVNSGASIATHLYNGMRSFNHREPGIVGAVLLDDRVYCEIIYDRVHVHDGAFELAYRLKNKDRLILISDSMMAAGLDDGIYELGGQRVTLSSGEARLDSGVLAGSVLTLDRAVKNVIDFLEIDLVDAIRMASLTPAEAIGANDRKGSIEVGKDADFIFIDKDINIHNIMLRGNLICQKKWK